MEVGKEALAKRACAAAGATGSADKAAFPSGAAGTTGFNIESCEIQAERGEIEATKKITGYRSFRRGLPGVWSTDQPAEGESALPTGASSAAEYAALASIATFGVIADNQVGDAAGVSAAPDDSDVLDIEKSQNVGVGPGAASATAAADQTAFSTAAAIARRSREAVGVATVTAGAANHATAAAEAAEAARSGGAVAQEPGEEARGHIRVACSASAARTTPQRADTAATGIAAGAREGTCSLATITAAATEHAGAAVCAQSAEAGATG